MKLTSYRCDKCGARTSKKGTGHKCVDRAQIIRDMIAAGELPVDYAEPTKRT